MSGNINTDLGLETEADRLRSAGLDEPESVIGNTNTDPGLETDAERIRSAGIDPD